MIETDRKIKRLQWLYVAYFVLVVGLDTFFSLKYLRGQDLGFEKFGLTPGMIMAAVIVIYAVILGGTLWLFNQLGQKKNWARILFLVGAWLAVVDAVSSLACAQAMSGLGNLMGDFAPGMDWEKLAKLDMAKDILGLIYWGYLIYVLQLASDVKKEFIQSGAPPARAE